MVEALASGRATIGELAGQVKDSEFNIFAQTVGLLSDKDTKVIFDNCRKEELRDPRIAIKFLKDEIRVIPLVNRLRNAESKGENRKLSEIPLNQEVLIKFAKSIGIKMRKDRLVTAVARLIERQEAQ